MTLYRGGCTVINFRPKAVLIDYRPIDTRKDPHQELIQENEQVPFTKKIDGINVRLIPLAKYKISARVVSLRHYYMDWISKLAPVDLALAWGELASNRFDKYITYSHSDRYYQYHYSGDFPGEPSLIINHSANEHLIGANSLINKALKSVKINEIVEIEGKLVNVDWVDGNGEEKKLKTSLTREDSGAGACEIIYVTKVKINQNVYQ